ncbi:hypothetical protein [Vibrio caribbeanicus]|uniref:hypothetical protein n=1 Tax=Vibrio caribbeanicus TaxID=701175 RepID=UPI0030DA4642
MKSIFTIAMLLTAANACGHSMSPITFGGKDKPLESISVTGSVVVPITVGSEITQDFIITVDGQEVDRLQIDEGQYRQADIPVKLNEPNRLEKHEVCSIGVGLSINTRICTQVKAYWLQRKSE